ncbi:MAG: hypothetical protein R3B68_10325 [Phycisphaerales bacterium]
MTECIGGASGVTEDTLRELRLGVRPALNYASRSNWRSCWQGEARRAA